MQKTIAQQLKVKDFPFEIKDIKDKTIYYENSDGDWYKCERDINGNETYFKSSNGYWCKKEYDANRKIIYSEDSTGFWFKCEYDDKGNEIYYANSYGTIKDNRPKPSVELTLDEIASKFNIPISQLKIKK